MYPFQKITLIGSSLLASVSAFAAGQMHVFESDAQGFNTKTYFYEAAKEVVAFDAQFTTAQAKAALAYLRTKTAKPVTYLVITHPNPDKFNGASAFQRAGAKVVASRATHDALAGVQDYKKNFFVNVAKMFSEADYPKLTSVDLVFDESKELKLQSGEKVQLSELGKAGVSSNQTVAYIPELRQLVVGDLVHYRAHAWFEGGVATGKPVPRIDSWIEVLNGLNKKFPASTTILGGRGREGNLKTVTAWQIEYLKRADRLVANYVRTLAAPAELSNEKANSHWEALRRKFEAEFPDTDLSYMIQYGVYGLALAKAADRQRDPASMAACRVDLRSEEGIEIELSYHVAFTGGPFTTPDLIAKVSGQDFATEEDLSFDWQTFYRGQAQGGSQSYALANSGDGSYRADIASPVSISTRIPDGQTEQRITIVRNGRKLIDPVGHKDYFVVNLYQTHAEKNCWN